MNEQEKTIREKYEKVEGRIRQWEAKHKRATLTEMEEAVDRELAQLRQEMIEELIQGQEGAEGERIGCPNCQKEMARNGKKKRRLKSKGGQEIEIEREQMRCSGCGMTLFPPG